MSWAMAAVAVAAVGVGMSYYNGQQQMAAQKDANEQAKKNALKQEQAADQANNAANRKTANVSGILSAAEQAGKGGVSGTMLTGAGGIDPNTLAISKNTLLGS